MESDATGLRRGTDCSTANSPTASMEPDATTPPAESSGVVANATKDATQDRSSRHNADSDKWVCYECRDGLCERCVGVPCQCECPDPHAAAKRADEEQKLARIRKDRANRFMVSAVDVDFLLQILERLNR